MSNGITQAQCNEVRSISEIFKSVFERSGLSMRQFAEKAFTTKSVVSRYVNGDIRKSPDRIGLVIIAKHWGCTEDEIDELIVAYGCYHLKRLGLIK